MKCPIDGSILKADRAEKHTGFGCESCKGSWLPKKYIDSIQFTKNFEPDRFYAELLSKNNEMSHAHCPSNCGVLNVASNAIGISYCVVCYGVWFEASALRETLKRYDNKDSSLTGLDTPNIIIAFFDFLRALFK